MKTRHIRTLTWIGSGVLLSGALLAMGAGLMLPYEAPRSVDNTAVKDASQSDAVPASSLTLDMFEGLWAMNLRRPLVDAPPPELLATPAFAPAPTETPEGLALSVRLLGTAFEHGHCFALVVGSDGKPQLKGVGEKLDNAEIVEINDGNIKLRSGEQHITIKTENRRQPDMSS